MTARFNVIKDGILRAIDIILGKIVTGDDIVMSGNGKSLTLPGMSTGNRPVSPVDGMEIYNTTLNRVERYEEGHWVSSTNYLQAGPTTDETTNSGVFVLVPGLQLTFPSNGRPALLLAVITLHHNVGAQEGSFAIYVDGVQAVADHTDFHFASEDSVVNLSHVAVLAAGNRTIECRWRVSGGVLSNLPTTESSYYRSCSRRIEKAYNY
jgi:hypothetical protein